MLDFLPDSLVSILYPQFCGACGRLVEKSVDGAACSDCWAATRFFDKQTGLCPKCGVFLTDSTSSVLGSCGLCDDHQYDSAHAAGIYHAALAASVLRLKRIPTIPRRVRDCLIESTLRIDLPNDYLVIPVPLSKKRLLERGFNQAAMLAGTIAKHAGRQLDEFTLVREIDTPMHRVAMDRKAREATVKSVFNVIRPALIENKHILLVDDVMTSGSTVSQCARVLKKTGAGKVIVLTLARAE